MATLATKKANRGLQRVKAEVFKALGHPIRVAIAELLEGGEACVCRIAQAIGAERSNVSRHLAVMVNAGVLTSRKEGLMVFYGLRTRCVLGFLACVESMLREQIADNNRVLRGLPAARR